MNELATEERPSFYGKRLLLASPVYGPRDPLIAKYLMAAIMTASNYGVRWAGDASSIRLSWEAGRDTAAKVAIESGADGVVWIDDDMRIPADAILNLLALEKDFTSGMYFQKVPPYWPLVAMFDGQTFQWLAEYPRNNGRQLVEVDGVGFGCAYTSTKLLKAIAEKHGKIFEWTKYSEDFTFCLRAGELGMKPWVDLSLKCGHSPLEPTFITEDDFLREKDRVLEEVTLENGGEKHGRNVQA